MYIFVLRQALACDRVYLRINGEMRAVIVTRVGYTWDTGREGEVEKSTREMYVESVIVHSMRTTQGTQHEDPCWSIITEWAVDIVRAL